MALRRRPDEQGGERWLEVDASMTGTLTFKDPVNLSINGRFEGTLDTKGSLSIGEHAQVEATIRGETILVNGSVQGTITATTLVELRAGARVTGKLITPRLITQDGAVIQGAIEMQGGQAAASSWMSVDDLARFLEVEAPTVLQWAQEGRLPGKRENGTWKFERTKVEEWLAQAKIK